MPDHYQIPSLILTVLLLPAFGYLYRRYRDTRTLLWLFGFLLSSILAILFSRMAWWNLMDGSHPWSMTVLLLCGLVNSGIFLGSLSSYCFRVGKFRVLYVIPYILPLLLYAILYAGVFRAVAPTGLWFLLFPGLGLIALTAAFFWNNVEDGPLPNWVGSAISLLFGGAGLWFFFHAGLLGPLILAECGNYIATALLLIFTYKRLSPGVLLSVLGFLAWSLPILLILHVVGPHSPLFHLLIRAIVLAKVVAAMGMILLALEDQLVINKASQERERRARQELEAYASLALSHRRVEDFDRQGPKICQAVVDHSRFSQAALVLLDNLGKYRLAGTAGLDAAIAVALETMAARIPAVGFLKPGSAPSAVEDSRTLKLDLEPWLTPGDDLKQLHFTSVLAVPMAGCLATDGALLLAGMRASPEPLRAEELLPVETLAARLQTLRSRTAISENLMDAEKFAGLGQLADNVSKQLNNPLTVIMGYASLLEEASSRVGPQERKGVESILSEARRMKSTLDSFLRVSRPQSDQLVVASITEMMTDIEQLHRPEFLHRDIEFRVRISPSLPKVWCRPQQLHQAVLHCLQFAMEMVENPSVADSSDPKIVRLEATAEENHVQILVAHSGAGFLNPEHAFDPSHEAQIAGETGSLRLSLCAAILCDPHSRISAVNLEPRGAALIMELQAA